MSQSCHLLLLLAKQKAAATEGVLQGMPGVTMPIYAMPSMIMPKLNHMAFLNLFMNYLNELTDNTLVLSYTNQQRNKDLPSD